MKSLHLRLLFDYIKLKISGAGKEKSDRSLDYLEGYVDAMLDVQDRVVALISASEKEE